MSLNMKHHPVMLKETLNIFEGSIITSFFDATVGAGGFAAALLTSHPEIEKYYACDRDLSALELSEKNLKSFESKVEFIHSNFSQLKEVIHQKQVTKLDGIFFDLGVSSMQLDDKNRGFSFLKEGALDMRMDQSKGITAKEIVNYWPQKELERIFRDYGDEKQWKKATRAIIAFRKKQLIESTTQLAKILSTCLKRVRKRLHPATLIFQALRIAVNEELDSIKKGVSDALEMLAFQKRIGVLSFQSLEDVIIKTLLKEASKNPLKPKIKILTRKPITPNFKEKRINPRSRSAKLRIGEKDE